MTVLDRMIPAETAFAASTKNRATARWPRRGGDNRLEPFAQVKVQPRFSIAPTDVVFTIGSCFARNIEEYLARMGMRVPTLDFKVPPSEISGRPSAILNKYTVPSILQEVERAARVLAATDEAERIAIVGETLLDLGDGTVIDMELVGLAPIARARGLERRQEIHDLYARAFEAEVVTLTFGLVEAWFDHETKRYIQETPSPALLKRFPGRFGFVMLDYQTCLEQARRVVEVLNATGGSKKIIITTSPVPLGRSFSGMDILIANCLAKSTLRAMCQALFHEFENVDYFPSYEMVTLSRDPSVWQDDLVHVSDAFVGRIVGTLMENYSPGLVGGLNVNGQAWLLLRDRKSAEAMALLEGAEDALGRTLLGMAMLSEARRADGLALVRAHAADANLAIDQTLWATNILVALEAWEIAAGVLDDAITSRKAGSRDAAIFLARRAICADGMGEAADAATFMERARQTHDSLPVATLASRLAVRQERLDDARELTLKVVSMHRGTDGTQAKIASLGAAYATLADIAARQGDRDAALRYCDDALWHGSDNPRYQALRKRIETAQAAD